MRKILAVTVAFAWAASWLLLAADDGQRGAGTTGAPPLPMPRFHHIHINSVDPQNSLDWYATFWPHGQKTTFAGMPAFLGDDVYLVFSKVAKRAPGAFDKKLQRSVPQSAFWTFGSTFTDTVGLVDRLTKLDSKRFEFLPVYVSPTDEKGVLRSALGPYGDQLLTITQLR
jgi:ABC-type oligopeptide transport system substrate-binding subunit